MTRVPRRRSKAANPSATAAAARSLSAVRRDVTALRREVRDVRALLDQLVQCFRAKPEPKIMPRIPRLER